MHFLGNSGVGAPGYRRTGEAYAGRWAHQRRRSASATALGSTDDEISRRETISCFADREAGRFHPTAGIKPPPIALIRYGRGEAARARPAPPSRIARSAP